VVLRAGDQEIGECGLQRRGSSEVLRINLELITSMRGVE